MLVANRATRRVILLSEPNEEYAFNKSKNLSLGSAWQFEPLISCLKTRPGLLKILNSIRSTYNRRPR